MEGAGTSTEEQKALFADGKGEVNVDIRHESHKVPVTRRRSYSVASTQPSVETVVVKAKRAAHSLWTLLHAQNCICTDRCPHSGCREAKMLHLHIKTCSALTGSHCPSDYKGCDEARKLMAHYKRCRNLRARQVNQLSLNDGNGDNPQQHVCLICSLVARQARSVLECPTKTLAKKGSSTKILVLPFKNKRSIAAAPTFENERTVMPPPSEKRSSTRVRFNEGANSISTFSLTSSAISTIEEEPVESDTIDLDFEIDLK